MPQGLGHSIKTFVQISLPVNSLWASPYIIISYLLSSPWGVGFGGLLSAIIIVIIVPILTVVCWAPNK